MNLNMLNNDILSTKRKRISELEFWMFYISAINITRQTLTGKETEFIAYLIRDCQKENYISKEHRKALAKEMKMSITNIPKLLKSLSVKKVILSKEDGYRVNSNLTNLKKYILKENKHLITLSFPVNIEL